MNNFISSIDDDNSIIVLFTIGTIISFCGIIYFLFSITIIPYFENKYVKQGGLQLVKYPISTKKKTNISSYQKLNGENKIKYEYSISFWFYIDSFSPNPHFSNILTYGKSLVVKYNALNNTLIILSGTNHKNKNNSEYNLLTSIEKTEYNLDLDGNVILYKQTNVFLQKWNHIVINYSRSNFDIFYNGNLGKSTNVIIPYIKYDNLTIGDDKNIVSAYVSNLIYYTHILDLTTINTLYKSMYMRNPPL
jgi:hypothetical protein